MPSPIIPKPVFSFSMVTTMTEGHALNTFYGVVTGVVGGQEDVFALTNACATAFYPKLAACLSSNCRIINGKGRYQSGANDWEAYTSHATATGANDGDPLPIQDCFEIRRLTGKPGRNMRGRVFFSGISEEDTQYGGIKDERVTAIQALAVIIKSNLIIGDRTINWRHWNRKGSTLEPITDATGVYRLVSRRDRAKKELYIPM